MATDFNQIELNDDQRHLLASAADHLGLPWPEVFEKAIGPLNDTWNVTEWLRAAAGNPVFADLADVAEDIYSIADGMPFHDEA